jgi:hypothetical protein
MTERSTPERYWSAGALRAQARRSGRALRAVLVGLAACLVIGLVWLLFVALPRWYAPQSMAATPPPAADPEVQRKIKATLFYVAEDGLSLRTVDAEVPFSEDTLNQARQILEAQLQPSPAPLMSAVPAATRVRGLYITPRGDAFVDLSPEVSTGHTGGSVAELFTVYTIVNALTVNLPAISGVQILVDGKEVDTLAGHVDLRRPLGKNLSWVATPDSTPPEATK